jgi:hypothetical protein
MLFGELCADRGAEVWLMLPLPENDFLEESVRLPDTNWEERYFDLSRRDGLKTFSQPLEAAPKGASVFARNNLWIIKLGACGDQRSEEPLRSTGVGREADERWLGRHGRLRHAREAAWRSDEDYQPDETVTREEFV